MKLDDDSRSISFKAPVSLTQLSKATRHFNNMYKALTGKDAKYTDFTDWLVTQDFVEVSPSLAEINEMVKKAAKK